MSAIAQGATGAGAATAAKLMFICALFISLGPASAHANAQPSIQSAIPSMTGQLPEVSFSFQPLSADPLSSDEMRDISKRVLTELAQLRLQVDQEPSRGASYEGVATVLYNNFLQTLLDARAIGIDISPLNDMIGSLRLEQEPAPKGANR